MPGLSRRPQRGTGPDRLSPRGAQTWAKCRCDQRNDSDSTMRRIALFLGVMIVAASCSVWGAERLDAPAEKPAGSGVIVHSDGYVLTAEHVIANAKRIFVVTAGDFRAPAILVS